MNILIVGGGIVGAACAEALSRDKVAVTLIEPGGVGCCGATAAGMGHLVAMDDSEAQFALTAYSSRLWNALAPELPRQAEFEARGTLWLAADDGEMNAVRAKHACYGRGSRMVQGREVASVLPGRVTLTDGSAIEADVVIVAAGVTSARLVPGGLPVRPRKGHLAITDRYPGFARHQLVELGYLRSAHGDAGESVAFNVQPRATGQVLIGSSRQFEVEHGAIDPPLLARMLERAFEYMPALADLSVIRTWTGFRAATPDNLPLIGPVEERLWVATGHEGLGITTSLGTAQLIADRLAGRTPAIPAEPYLPARFS